MKKFPIVVVITALALCALPAIASAGPYNRGCQGGTLVGTNITEGIHVGMSYGTAASIAGRVGVAEFGYHVKPTEVPCDVGESVSYNAAHAYYYNWRGNDGWIGAGWIGYSRGPWFGAFYCAGYTTTSGSVQESCAHRADHHAGQMTVSFQIAGDPNQ